MAGPESPRCVNSTAPVPPRHLADLCPKPEFGPCRVHQAPKHRNDLARRTVTEKLAKRLFIPRDTVPIHKVDEIPLAIAAERGFAEMRIARQEGLRVTVKIGEIAPPATRNADLLARCARVIDA